MGFPDLDSDLARKDETLDADAAPDNLADRRLLEAPKEPADSGMELSAEEEAALAAVLRAASGTDQSDLGYTALLDASRRPHIFSIKSRFRHVPDRRPIDNARLIGEREFAELYAAAEFAECFDLWFDTTVTINWGKLAPAQPVEKLFTNFTKCLRAWLPPLVPYAAIYCHESGLKGEVHTHLALFVPTYLRRPFREWAMSWQFRQFGAKVPGAMRVRTHKTQESWLHWVTFSYIVKGYDPSAVVLSARNAPDQQSIMLGDLIAAPFRNPGPTDVHRRTGCSRSIGPAARAKGVPAGFEFLKFVDRRDPISGALMGKQSIRDHLYPPFRSKYEDGIRDVRKLYSAEFLGWYDRPNRGIERFPCVDADGVR